MGKWKKIGEVKRRRSMAMDAAKKEVEKTGFVAPADGDIFIHIVFVPSDNRGDRVNFAGRMKAYIDGLAEAIGVNDKRFLPSYEYCAPQKPGEVKIKISTGSSPQGLADAPTCHGYAGQ